MRSKDAHKQLARTSLRDPHLNPCLSACLLEWEGVRVSLILNFERSLFAMNKELIKLRIF